MIALAIGIPSDSMADTRWDLFCWHTCCKKQSQAMSLGSLPFHTFVLSLFSLHLLGVTVSNLPIASIRCY